MGLIRIIAGELKGRRIQVPEGPGVRPTPDRVREALFSILGGLVEEARVLDAYAGSGALGFEALSRGAAEVVFLESEPGPARVLRQSADSLGVTARCRIIEAGAQAWLRGVQRERPFDLFLADPPYGTDEAEGFLASAHASGLLAPGGWLVLERDSRDRPVGDPAPDLSRFRTAKYGRTSLDLYRRG